MPCEDRAGLASVTRYPQARRAYALTAFAFGQILAKPGCPPGGQLVTGVGRPRGRRSPATCHRQGVVHRLHRYGKESCAPRGQPQAVTLEPGQVPRISSCTNGLGAAARTPLPGFPCSPVRCAWLARGYWWHESVLDDFPPELPGVFRVPRRATRSTNRRCSARRLGLSSSAGQLLFSPRRSAGSRSPSAGAVRHPPYFVEHHSVSRESPRHRWRAMIFRPGRRAHSRSATRERGRPIANEHRVRGSPRVATSQRRPRTAWPGNCARASCGSTLTRADSTFPFAVQAIRIGRELGDKSLESSPSQSVFIRL